MSPKMVPFTEELYSKVFEEKLQSILMLEIRSLFFVEPYATAKNFPFSQLKANYLYCSDTFIKTTRNFYFTPL